MFETMIKIPPSKWPTEIFDAIIRNAQSGAQRRMPKPRLLLQPPFHLGYVWIINITIHNITHYYLSIIIVHGMTDRPQQNISLLSSNLRKFLTYHIFLPEKRNYFLDPTNKKDKLNLAFTIFSYRVIQVKFNKDIS